MRLDPRVRMRGKQEYQPIPMLAEENPNLDEAISCRLPSFHPCETTRCAIA
jgi:hypothetical protein